jgi:hypothetical protein
MRLPLVLALALFAAVGWYVESQRVEIARLERDLQAERGLRATERQTREAQARRAIETARRQEQESRDEVDAARHQAERDLQRVAGDLAGAQRRLRDIPRATATAAAPDGCRVPAAAAGPAGGDGADPIGLLVAHGEALYRVVAEADAAAVRARLIQQWIGAVSAARPIEVTP